ncbi:MAG: bifunctional demethylmenaquinone methyltransferase/2-methoxy-6-polyprenyl-1,4-benzoquinol methylase UbiE [Acidobacteria bacterium]|nr:bifunctional demethylmenaquinone methyltransferase/2-methoxy-6-polyprenyl-1,4-benzoquinol methylase UbiE [Acidobacteriota bacterium]
MKPGPSEVRGAAVEGPSDADSVSRTVERMFSSIAPRYDLLNHLLSANVDKLWWRRAAGSFSAILSRPGVQVLDLCCGTGDMAFALYREGPRARITGADFSHPMLTRARAKSPPRTGGMVTWVEADALRLPFADQSFDLVTSAFGLRNLADYDLGLREIWRVLRPGGACGIVEFAEPGGILGRIYSLYFRHVLPRIGGLVSGVQGAYSYLPASVARFPAPPEMIARMQSAGFRNSEWMPYTFGIAGLFRGGR